MPALWPWQKIQRDWRVCALASPVIESALHAPDIAILVHALPQSWVSAQMCVASVWQSAKNTQVMIQRAKLVRKPVASVSNTVKEGRNKPLGLLEASVTKATLLLKRGDVGFCDVFKEACEIEGKITILKRARMC